MKEYKLPEILKQLLAENNMTQNKFAKEMGLSAQAIHKWINFLCVPSLFSLMEIASYFNVSIDYLVYGEKK